MTAGSEIQFNSHLSKSGRGISTVLISTFRFTKIVYFNEMLCEGSLSLDSKCDFTLSLVIIIGVIIKKYVCALVDFQSNSDNVDNIYIDLHLTLKAKATCYF